MAMAIAVGFEYPRQRRNLDQYETEDCPSCGRTVYVSKETLRRTHEAEAEFRVQCSHCKAWFRGRV